MTERIIWTGIDALYEQMKRISEAWLLGIGMMTGVLATNEQVMIESPQRGEQ